MSSPRGPARHLHGGGGAGPAHSSTAAALSHSRASGSSRQALHPPTLHSDTVVFQNAKLPSRQAANAGAAPMSSSSQTYAGSRAEPGSLASYSNSSAWSAGSSSSIGATGVAPPQRAPGYQRYRDEQDGRVPASSSSREFDRNGRESASRRHQYGNSPLDLSRRVPSAARGGSDADRQHPHALDAADSDSYADDRENEEAGGEHGTSFTNLLQDAVASTSPRSVQLQQRSQGRPVNALPVAGGNPPSIRDTGANIVRMTIRVMKEGNKLGFGIRHDSQRKLRVSTLQGNSAAAKSHLRLGDILLSVNGITLNDLGFLEVIQHLKATKPGELVFDIERDVNASPGHSYDYPDVDMGEEYLGESASSYTQTAQMPGAGRVSKVASSNSGPPSRQASPQLGSASSAAIDHGLTPSRTANFDSSSMDTASSMAVAGMTESQRKRARPYVLSAICLFGHAHGTNIVNMLLLPPVHQARLLTLLTCPRWRRRISRS